MIASLTPSSARSAVRLCRVAPWQIPGFVDLALGGGRVFGQRLAGSRYPATNVLSYVICPDYPNIAILHVILQTSSIT